ncbi:uncharacterized protein PgNI_02960 [Pyricularia grisea]|uniref:Heterokaryon incompatibility domain-containing protein n=1 Tax=Pyricularia grisea TaxID=148305 RepID=A0A6P8B9Q9_PYRGI|nr:uncharacterized protein PgNI_02960 [Pyricularia grisea]TLD12541.1 hypothetical protein PgNI_02960 [Pyricularia grisea]
MLAKAEPGYTPANIHASPAKSQRDPNPPAHHPPGPADIYDFDKKPAYSALSYAWGDAQQKTRIFINGSPIEVNKSLAAAPHRIRDPGDVVRVWADAVCINQQDTEEKTHQIGLMQDIYRECERCLVWMGDVSIDGQTGAAAVEAAQAALDALSLIGGERMCRGETLRWPGSDPIAYSPSGQGLTAGAALKSFMRCAWWQRIWTVQEVCLPATSTLLWGPLEMEFNAIIKAARSMVELIKIIRAARTMVEPEENSQANKILDLFSDGDIGPFTVTVFSIDQARSWTENRTDALDRLWRFQPRHASSPNDKKT